MQRRRKFAVDAVLVVLASTVVIIPQWYLQISKISLGWNPFLGAVLFPLAFGSALFWFSKRKIALFAFLAYFWAMTEDAPVYLDSVFTWPEVTSGVQHIALEILFHLLTLLFMILAIREATKGAATSIGQGGLLKVFVLGAVALTLAYFQNLPIDTIQDLVVRQWIPLDIVEHVLSIGVFYSAIREALKVKKTHSHSLLTSNSL